MCILNIYQKKTKNIGKTRLTNRGQIGDIAVY
jgi:hypothetical protein